MGAQLRLSDETLPGHLRALGLLAAGERATVEAAGDGNINWVRRVRIQGRDARSFVVKQARPALERFPEYHASPDRLLFEARYLERARRFDADGVLPAVLALDAPNRLLVLEDLGGAERMDAALARGADVADAAGCLAAFLARVHAGTAGDEALANAFANDDMRRLHGDHVFALPLRPNDFPLSPALGARAAALQADAELVALADAAYARYLAPRGALVHGDVQAGNVLLRASGPTLLDAEIAHVGDPAFDLGTLLAHLALPALAAGRAAQPHPALAAALGAYRAAGGPAAAADAFRYAGIELLRRTIGAARVPAVAQDEASLAVLGTAVDWIKRPPAEVPR